MHYGCPGFIQDAAAAGLDNEPAEIAALKAELRARRDLVCDRLDGVAGLERLKPEAGMFVMLDVRATGLAAFDFASGLLESQAVSLLPADAFGQSARGHLRIGLCSSRDVLAEACRRIVLHTEDVMRRRRAHK
jgi:arginine:pyruvate transaminase